MRDPTVFDDVIFLCFRTQLRPAVSYQIHRPLNAGDTRYTMLRCCSESARDCYNFILCFKTQLRSLVVNKNSKFSRSVDARDIMLSLFSNQLSSLS